MLTLFIRAILCNWMVSTAVTGAMMSTTVGGKVLAMWMPVMLFFAMTFEHSIVNMFLFPAGLLLGAKFTLRDYLIWNKLPTIAGNFLGGVGFTALTLHAAHGRNVDFARSTAVDDHTFAA
jgi:formate transporter